MNFHRISFRARFLLNLTILLFTYGTIAQEFTEGNIANKKIHKNINSLYHSEIVGVSKAGLIQGQSAMKTYLLNFQKSYGPTIEAKTHYVAPVYQVLEYEIGSFKTAKGGQFAKVIIWSTTKVKQKMVEIVFKQTNTKSRIPANLAKARAKWMELCNKKKAKKLVSELYTDDAIYYNRGRILRGHEQLSQEYSYMEGPSYSLQLQPKHIEVVSETLIYEIGLCSGSYNLPYILIWKKESNGDWKIYLDSNY